MIYSWKLQGLYQIEAQTAGNELERIYAQTGRLDPATIVRESESEDAVLHPLFEWNDREAAKQYREHQARQIVRALVTVAPTPTGPVQARAFVRTEVTYEPLSVALQSTDKARYLLQKALAELTDFQHRYNTLEALQPVFQAIDDLATG